MTSISNASHNNQTRVYDRETSVVFLKTKERFGGLSNMAAGFPLRVNRVRIKTSEALYQACRFPHMPEVQQLIIGENSPMRAKMRSKPYRRVSRHDWDFVRVKIMRWCLRVKLAQNWREFGRLLLATGDRPIVEQSRKDDFWGAKVAEDGTLVGMNVLGRLLMELREQLKGDEAESLRFIEPLAISEFLLFGQPIEAVQAASNVEIPGRPLRMPSEVEKTTPPSESQPSLFDRAIIRTAASELGLDESQNLPSVGEHEFKSDPDKIRRLVAAFHEVLLVSEYVEPDKAGVTFAEILFAKVAKNEAYNNAVKCSRKQVALAEFDKSLAQAFAEIRLYHEDFIEKLEGNPDVKKSLSEKAFMATYYD
tara:strand:- start:2293 stop:3387 length:1095 start_codon:yes stop_codon:yes gene_type:complete